MRLVANGEKAFQNTYAGHIYMQAVKKIRGMFLRCCFLACLLLYIAFAYRCCIVLVVALFVVLLLCCWCVVVVVVLLSMFFFCLLCCLLCCCCVAVVFLLCMCCCSCVIVACYVVVVLCCRNYVKSHTTVRGYKYSTHTRHWHSV
jgi:hypothetical protein